MGRRSYRMTSAHSTARGERSRGAEWAQHEREWLPTAEDRAFVAALMGRVVEPGKFANWIAPPVMGINRQPIDFQYVRFN